MSELLDWNPVWTRIESWCRVLIARVEAAHPRAVPFPYRAAPTEFFPFAASVAFAYKDDLAGDDAGCISFDAHSDGQRLLLTADLLRGSHSACLDGPTETIPFSAGRAAIEAAVTKWADRLEHFILDEACPMLIANMNADAAAKGT